MTIFLDCSSILYQCAAPHFTGYRPKYADILHTMLQHIKWKWQEEWQMAILNIIIMYSCVCYALLLIFCRKETSEFYHFLSTAQMQCLATTGSFQNRRKLQGQTISTDWVMHHLHGGQIKRDDKIRFVPSVPIKGHMTAYMHHIPKWIFWVA